MPFPHPGSMKTTITLGQMRNSAINSPQVSLFQLFCALGFFNKFRSFPPFVSNAMFQRSPALQSRAPKGKYTSLCRACLVQPELYFDVVLCTPLFHLPKVSQQINRKKNGSRKPKIIHQGEQITKLFFVPGNHLNHKPLAAITLKTTLIPKKEPL